MADKQATIYVIDVGSTTGKVHEERNESDLEFGLRYFWLKIAETLAANRATWSVGVIAFRSDETRNPLKLEGYHNISVLKHLGKIELTDVEKIRPQLVPSHTEDGDAISAIVVAITEMVDFTQLKSGKPGKFNRKIVLLTDGQGLIDDEGSDEIAKKINESDIELVVIGIDFDDPEFGYKEESKSFLKVQNESLLKDLVCKCEKSTFGTAAAAIEQISLPSARVPKAYLNYEGYLGLGDFKNNPSSSISIEVRRYFKTKKAMPPSASKFVIKTPITEKFDDSSSSQTIEADQAMENCIFGGSELSIVRDARSYVVDDPTGPGGKKYVPVEELAKGYLYGRTIVPMNEADEGVTRFDTIKSFTIIGFIPCEEYGTYLKMGESCITIAQQHNDQSRLAMSSLVHALHELESYAVARIVTKNDKAPSIILLAPLIVPGDVEALVDVPLPFAEDIRIHKFPPIDKILTVSGAEVKSHRNLPSSDLTKAMSDYVDAMDLSSFGTDDGGQPKEYLPMGEIYNPSIHRINHAIRQRAMYPNQPVSLPPDDHLLWSKPHPKLVLEATEKLQRLITTASVKSVPAEVRGKRKGQVEDKPLSGLDIDAILGSENP